MSQPNNPLPALQSLTKKELYDLQYKINQEIIQRVKQEITFKTGQIVLVNDRFRHKGYVGVVAEIRTSYSGKSVYVRVKELISLKEIGKMDYSSFRGLSITCGRSYLKLCTDQQISQYQQLISQARKFEQSLQPGKYYTIGDKYLVITDAQGRVWNHEMIKRTRQPYDWEFNPFVSDEVVEITKSQYNATKNLLKDDR